MTEESGLWISPYRDRPQFTPLHDRKTRWFIGVSHRRAGKTVACINELIMAATQSWRYRSRFAYIAPQLNQAKDVAWKYLTDYTAFIATRKVSETELWVEFPTPRGTTAKIRLYGAENPDRLRGGYFDGVVLDEFGDMDPAVWTSVVRPMLSDRRGFACFIGTPKGRNGFYKLWQRTADDPDWTRLMLKASESGILPADELADVRASTPDEDEYAREYECSFDAAVRGTYFAAEMRDAAAAGRIASVPYDPRLPVHTAWDLGMADSTVIWFVQVNGGETRLIDVLKGEGKGLDWYAAELQSRPYVWGEHYLPHDAAVRELGTGKSRIEVLEGYGIRATLCPLLPLADGIQALRMLLPTCRFDEAKCASGIEALRMYRRNYNSKQDELSAAPLHDWTSHYADALRSFAVGFRPPPPSRRPPKRDNRWVA